MKLNLTLYDTIRSARLTYISRFIFINKAQYIVSCNNNILILINYTIQWRLNKLCVR